MGEALTARRVDMSFFSWTAPLFKLSRHRWSENDFRHFAEYLRPCVPPGGLLLDLGGGTGDLGLGVGRVLGADGSGGRRDAADAAPRISRPVDLGTPDRRRGPAVSRRPLRRSPLLGRLPPLRGPGGGCRGDGPGRQTGRRASSSSNSGAPVWADSSSSWSGFSASRGSSWSQRSCAGSLPPRA